MYTRPKRMLLITILVALAGARAAGQANPVGVGIDAYFDGRYGDALSHFREALVDPGLDDLRGDAYFWIAKASLAELRLDEAARNLEFYLSQYQGHRLYSEAEYLRGRLLYLQADYQGALVQLARYVDRYPDDDFVSNAYYWSGESAFAMDLLDDAYDLFSVVTSDYPNSYRAEAARYRLAVIELARREAELLELLRWSHEEALAAMEIFRRTEATYKEAIETYRDRLESLAAEDFQAEIGVLRNELSDAQDAVSDAELTIASLENQVSTLQERLIESQDRERELLERVADLQDRLSATPSQGSTAVSTATATDTATTEELMQMKDEALELKEFYLQWLASDRGDGDQ